MALQRYLDNRRTWEVLIAAAFILVSLFANVGVVSIEFARGGEDWDRWVPWPGSSSRIWVSPMCLPLRAACRRG